MDLQTPVNSSKAKELDKSSIFTDVSKALFEDFHKLASGKDADADFFRLLSAYESISSFGVRTMRKLANNPEVGSNELNTTLEQLEKERDGYKLMRRLMKAEAEALGAQDSQLKSVLSSLLCKDTEFRRLRVLLHWVEEVALDDPQFYKELSSDFSDFNDVAYLFQNTQIDLHKEPGMCTLDFDGRFGDGAEINLEDEALVEKLSRLILHLMKCGRYNEVKNLLDKCGFPGLVPFVMYKDFVNDPSLSVFDKEDENHELYKARKEFKETARLIVNQDECPLPRIEQCMLSLLTGSLEPLKSYSSATTHKLFAYLNSSLEARMDMAFEENNGNDFGKRKELSINAIFDEIGVLERSPYYPVYRYITLDESERAVSHMLEWAREMKRKSQLKAKCHVFRFFIHLTLMFKTVGSPFKEVELHQMIRDFVEILKEMDYIMLIPFYLSHLPRDEAVTILVDFLYDLEDTKIVRTDLLEKASKVGFQPATLCELVYDKVLRENEKPDADDSTALKIYNIFPYLLYCGTETAERALMEANNLLRMFFELERLDLGTDLFEVINATNPDVRLDELVLAYWQKKGEEMSDQCYDNLQEFLQYRDYYATLDVYDEWAKGWASEPPVLPEPLLRSQYEQLSVSEKNKYATDRRLIKEKCAKHVAQQQELKKKAVLKLNDLLLLDTQLFVPRHAEETTKNKERAEKLALLRPKYIAKVYIMLINLFVETQDSDGLIEVGASLVDSTTEHYKILSMEQLRSLNGMLSGEVECFVTEQLL